MTPIKPEEIVKLKEDKIKNLFKANITGRKGKMKIESVKDI